MVIIQSLLTGASLGLIYEPTAHSRPPKKTSQFGAVANAVELMQCQFLEASHVAV